MDVDSDMKSLYSAALAQAKPVRQGRWFPTDTTVKGGESVIAARPLKGSRVLLFAAVGPLSDEDGTVACFERFRQPLVEHLGDLV
jgi:hypothetical protein